ncbi:MAG TPA: cytochrome-c oxidase, cbb3-type subunit III [Candidatus Competibacter sp.]|nr:cytochrome-c oxidase, cbb3-type subunit III [Candidatus Competibacteraceae bacterium]HRE53979.1 cytochrome-c oxidase, cbb3-type subunit III [Candidatus Competibacter sp.]HUM94515.1 cytochrome-c oxidase, cbb3-type subunit III [Candidatus Competibacter sp.]
MSEQTSEKQTTGAVQTTGHAWDGDLQEYNNPLPRWWLWCFYGTAVFSVLYWFIYPSWPVGQTWLKGFGSVSYTVADKATGKEKEQEFRWNTRSLLLEDLSDAANNQQRKDMLAKVQAAQYDQILKDPKMMEFVRSVGKGLFGDNCAACHGRGGQGVAGMYPNLTDDDWLWGSDMEQIHQTLAQGRKGYMPAFGPVLKPEQLDDVAEYVLVLSSETASNEASERGKAIFHGQVGGCYYCHGADAKGVPSQGAANLTDRIWAIADVPGQKNLQDKKNVVKNFIATGVNNTRIMPPWKDRLSPTDIKLLAVYVRQLGGGKQ